jgi:hypothetical protein
MSKARKNLAPKESEPVWQSKERAGEIEVLSVSDRIKTVDDAIKYGGFDLKYWYVHESEATSYESPMKLYTTEGFNPKGKPKRVSDRPRIIRLWRVKLKLKRRVSRSAEVEHKELLEQIGKQAPFRGKLPRPKITDPHLFELSLFDKLAWRHETGQDYDLKIARENYVRAITELCNKGQMFPIEKILMPIGNDFFHVDNQENKTTRGTPQDADGRYPKIWAAGKLAVIEAIERLVKIAPVEVLYVPGNHDLVASFHLCDYLSAYFRNTKDVKVDTEPKERKYYQYGPVVLGFTHGDEECHRDLPGLMLHEARKLMAKASTLEIHLGHLHKAKETVHVNTDTFSGGTRVRVLPSLSGTDKWHYRKGYISHRAAEAYLWSKRTGYVGHFSANVPR